MSPAEVVAEAEDGEVTVAVVMIDLHHIELNCPGYRLPHPRPWLKWVPNLCRLPMCHLLKSACGNECLIDNKHSTIDGLDTS